MSKDVVWKTDEIGTTRVMIRAGQLLALLRVWLDRAGVLGL